MLRRCTFAPLLLLALAGCADRATRSVPAPAPAPRAAVPSAPAPEPSVVAPTTPLPFTPATIPAAPPPPPRLSALPPSGVAAPVASCATRPDPAFGTRIPAGSLDAALLDRAVLFHSNRARCRLGLRPLGPDPLLRTTATGHSADMVRLGFFGHASPVPGRATMGQRLRASGVRYRAAAENLATAKRLEIGDGQPVYPLGTDRCAYSLTPRGRRVPVRTYDSLARNLVTRWLESPGHRRNLLNPAYTRHGASGVIDPTGRICDTISATQLFAG